MQCMLPKVHLSETTDKIQNACLLGDNAHLEGICADNPKGFCQLDGGVASYFRVFTGCLSKCCPSDDERMCKLHNESLGTVLI